MNLTELKRVRNKELRSIAKGDYELRTMSIEDGSEYIHLMITPKATGVETSVCSTNYNMNFPYEKELDRFLDQAESLLAKYYKKISQTDNPGYAIVNGKIFENKGDCWHCCKQGTLKTVDGPFACFLDDESVDRKVGFDFQVPHFCRLLHKLGEWEARHPGWKSCLPGSGARRKLGYSWTIEGRTNKLQTGGRNE